MAWLVFNRKRGPELSYTHGDEHVGGVSRIVGTKIERYHFGIDTQMTIHLSL
jgi:hypothetical protein